MHDFDKVIGVLFIAIGIVDLLRQDWVHFGLLGAAGAGLLINPKSSKLAWALQAVLFAVAGVMMIARIATAFSK